ncbi:hypothetical protein [Enterococcus mundtii]|uniref:hypothetical protein n=1 Tax=Enterococcus mundtii TaxID=53346 RepID=UPI000CF1BF7B|nr:hypothetical protein [Enterococcus mundtii]PQC31328.1 hypothetical protein CUM97_06395 [Enterococcus mundtii]
MEGNKNQKLFMLLSRVYNTCTFDNKDVKDGLLEAAKVLQQEDYTKSIIIIYKNLAKLKAEQRIQIPEIRELTEFIKEDYQRISKKELRNNNIGYGITAIPYIF